jgi:hypothetical protein
VTVEHDTLDAIGQRGAKKAADVIRVADAFERKHARGAGERVTCGRALDPIGEREAAAVEVESSDFSQLAGRTGVAGDVGPPLQHRRERTRRRWGDQD